MISNRKSRRFKKFLFSNDAVSEVLDFVTMIGILLLCLTVIGLVGYPALKGAQETRYVENTRQSFIVLAENINKIAMGNAPSRGVELKMYGGSLKVTGNSTIGINATIFNATTSSNEIISLLETTSMRSIENSVGDTVVAYEGTGVWVKFPTGVILNPYRPLITSQNNILVIPVVLHRRYIFYFRNWCKPFECLPGGNAFRRRWVWKTESDLLGQCQQYNNNDHWIIFFRLDGLF